MRQQSQLHPQPRVIATPREPGPDPRPRKRRSTAPQNKEAVDQATHQAEPVAQATAVKAKPRKGKACGSSKPRYALTKALLRLALQEGLHQLAEDRAETDVVSVEPKRSPKEQEYHRAFLEAAQPKEEEPNEIELCLVSVIILPDGKEELAYHDKNGPQLPAKPTKTLEQIMNEQKLRRIIETSMAGKVSINIGDLLAAAMKDERIKKLIEETPPPAPKLERTSSRFSSSSSRKASSSRPTLGSSHTGRDKKSKLH